MSFHMDTVEEFFEAYGKALSSGDAAEIAAFYGTPAMVLRNSGASAVLTRRGLIDAFAGLAESYRLAHLHQAFPAVTAMEQLAPGLISVDVEWTSLDDEGTPTGHREAYRYLVCREGAHQCIQVVIAKDAGHEE